MSLIHCIPLTDMTVFSDLFKEAWRIIKSTCEFQQLDTLYDSYIKESVKEGERKRWMDCDPLELVNFSVNKKIPVQIDRFWACPSNKHSHQMVSRDYFLQ